MFLLFFQRYLELCFAVFRYMYLTCTCSYLRDFLVILCVDIFIIFEKIGMNVNSSIFNKPYERGVTKFPEENLEDLITKH